MAPGRGSRVAHLRNRPGGAPLGTKGNPLISAPRGAPNGRRAPRAKGGRPERQEGTQGERRSQTSGRYNKILIRKPRAVGSSMMSATRSRRAFTASFQASGESLRPSTMKSRAVSPESSA